MKALLEKHQTLAKVLAAAVCDLAPKAQLINAAGTRQGFFADFVFNDPMAPHQLRFIEDRMQQILKSESIEELNMMGDNLAVCLREKGQVLRAAQLREFQGEVLSVVKIGPFFDFSLFPFEIRDLTVPFKLKSMEEKGTYPFRGRKEKVTRLTGSCGQGKILKDHLEIGAAGELFSTLPVPNSFLNEGLEFVWHPKGARLRRQLIDFWVKALEGAGFGVIETQKSLEEYSRLYMKEGKLAHLYAEESQNFSNGLIEPLDSLCDKALVIGPIDESEFLLQFIVKTINMLGLKWHPYLVRSVKRAEQKEEALCEEILRKAAEQCGLECQVYFSRGPKSSGAKIELKIEDAFGFEWTGPYLKVSRAEGLFIFELSLFHSVERIIALLLEQSQEALCKIGLTSGG